MLSLLEKGSRIRVLNLRCDQNLFSDSYLFDALDTKGIDSLEADNISIEILTTPGRFQKLRSLSLTEFQEPLCDKFDFSHCWSRYTLSADRRRISPVENLDVILGDTHPLTLLPLLHWIAGLKSINLNLNLIEMDWVESSTKELQRMLDIHSDTLQSITFTTIPQAPYEHALDFRHFPELHTLQFPADSLLLPGWAGATWGIHYEVAALNLTAPRLVELMVDMSEEQVEYEPPGQIDADHCVWLEGFIREYQYIVPSGGIRQIRLINVNTKTDGLKKA